MCILDKITVSEIQAPRITIYGKSGVGKTSLAKQFPDPLFLLTERPTIMGLKEIKKPKTLIEYFNNINELLSMPEIPYKTIVIDGLTGLDKLIEQHIFAEEARLTNGKSKPKTLAQACGGFGKGFDRARSLHNTAKELIDTFNERGLGVVYIGHLTTIKHKAPDVEDYDIYSIDMNSEKSRAIYIQDVDAVLFLKQETFSFELDSGRNSIKSTEKRLIETSLNAGTVSKNRYDMPKELPASFEEIAKYIPFYNQQHKELQS
jgi:hypothetical protein